MSDEERKTPPPAGGEGKVGEEKVGEEKVGEGRAPAAAGTSPPAQPAGRGAAPPPEEQPPWERDAATPEWVEAEDDPLTRALRQRFGGKVLSARSFAGTLTFEIERQAIAEVARFLKDEHRFTYLVDLCGADYSDRDEGRFDVVYHLHRFDDHRRIRLRVKTGEEDPVPTVSGVWRTANWSEREAYDMFGIRFADHPDLTRILLWEGFNGHPLRKDFPVEGIDTGSAIYPEYYEAEAGPIAGTGTGWKAPKPPAEPEAEPPGEAN